MKFSKDYLNLGIHARIEYKKYKNEISNPFNLLYGKESFYKIETILKMLWVNRNTNLISISYIENKIKKYSI
jgi:hypothetical protein